MKRRDFVSSVLAAAVGGASLRSVLAQPSQLPRTPRDYEGPYYPTGERHRTSDLLVGEPRDTVLYFSGRVVDVDGRPLAGALVDIWQADPLGRYDHPRDRSSGERWSEFLYWAEATTDSDGRFEFRTYTPGEYGRRPPHIHYKIWHEKKRLLTSQVYFARFGGARNASLTDEGELQTVRLADDGDARRCHLRVVV